MFRDVHMYLCVYVSTHVRVGAGACRDTRSWHWVCSPGTHHLTFWSRLSFLNLELAGLARLAGQGAPSAGVSPVLGLWRSAAVPGLCCGVLGNEVRSSHMHSQSLPDSHLHSPACVYEIAVFHSPSPRFYHKSKNLYETALILFSLANRTPSDLTHFQCAKRSLHFRLSSFPPLVSQHCF